MPKLPINATALADQPLSELVREVADAHVRITLAKYAGIGPVDPADCWIEVVYGNRIACEATAARWGAVADLLGAHAIESWAQVGNVLGLTEIEARDGFHDWIGRQVALHRRTDREGLTNAQAAELYRLSEAVGW